MGRIEGGDVLARPRRLCSSPSPAAPPPAPPPAYDTVIRGGTIYDGSGGAPYTGDVAIKGDRIAAVAPRIPGRGRTEVDARGLAVAPGFINMLSWAAEPLIRDGRAQSDVRQGVTLEVMGEGWSMGPFSPTQKAEAEAEQTATRYPIKLDDARRVSSTSSRRRGSASTSPRWSAPRRSGSTSSAATTSIPTPEQLARMRALVRQAMDEGAMGVGSSLIYVPAVYAETDELVALAERGGALRRACISATCAARAAGCSRRSTSWSRSAAARAPAPKSTISRRRAAPTGR